MHIQSACTSAPTIIGGGSRGGDCHLGAASRGAPRELTGFLAAGPAEDVSVVRRGAAVVVDPRAVWPVARADLGRRLLVAVVAAAAAVAVAFLASEVVLLFVEDPAAGDGCSTTAVVAVSDATTSATTADSVATRAASLSSTAAICAVYIRFSPGDVAD